MQKQTNDMTSKCLQTIRRMEKIGFTRYVLLDEEGVVRVVSDTKQFVLDYMKISKSACVVFKQECFSKFTELERKGSQLPPLKQGASCRTLYEH